MLNFDEVTEKSSEEKLMEQEEQTARLLNYDRKIDKIIHCILTEKEAAVFDMRIGDRSSWAIISQKTRLPSSTIRTIFSKIERKLQAFRNLFDLA